MQDTFYYETFVCSYEAYVTKLIDELSMDHSSSDDTPGEYHQNDFKIQCGSLTTSPDKKSEHE